jgi:hypothetical protein
LRLNYLKTCLFICFALISTVASAASYAQRLERIYRDYHALGEPKDVQRLVELDAELVALELDVRKKFPAPIFFKEKHKIIGVWGDRHNDQMQYSRKLLYDAHRINPNSSFRSYTLYTTIKKNFWETPDLKQTRRYLLEFPDGPFAAEAHRILGTFYFDLSFLLVRYSKDPDAEKDERDNCFAPYIDKTAFEKQLMRSKQRANQHLNMAYQIKKDANIKQALVGLKIMKSDLMHWCVDD